MKNVPNFVNDESNFVNDVPNLVKDVPRVPKSVPRWGTTFQSLPKGLQMNKWTMRRKIGVLLA